MLIAPVLMHRRFMNLAKLSLSLGLIWFSFSRIDSAQALALLRTLRPAVVVPVIALLMIQHALGGLRFHQLLEEMKTPVSLRAAIENSFAGLFFGQIFLSFIGGDAVRILRLVNGALPAKEAFKAVLFDRVLGFVSVIALIALCLPLLFGIVTSDEMRIGLLLAVGIGALATLVFLFMHRLPQTLLRWKIFRFAADISMMALSIAGCRLAMAKLFGLSLVIHIMNVGAIFLIARGLGVTASFMDCLALVPPVMLLAILPISFAGWGVREGSMLLALGLVGIGPEQSVAISICFGLCLLASSLPGAWGWLKQRKSERIRPNGQDTAGGEGSIVFTGATCGVERRSPP